jgi:HK97 family phage major capsid protein
MTLKEQIKDAQKKANALLDKVKSENRAFTAEEQKEFDGYLDSIKSLQQTLDSIEKMADVNNSLNEPQTPLDYGKPKDSDPKLFKNFGEQLKAIREAGVNPSNTDPRLIQINNAATGASSGVGPDGGFAIQTDFARQMLESAYQESGILSACDTYEIGQNSNGAQWLDIDETDISTTVYGGVQAYWAAEAATVDSKKPKLIKQKLDLEKILGIGYATDELIEDTTFMSDLYSRAFTAAIMRTAESAIFSGDGIGKPLGILKSGSTISVAKVTDQTADTVIHKNIVDMWLRLHWSKRNSAVWYIHPDIEAQLEMMIFTGSASNPVPIYMPPTGLSQNAYSTLKGRPVIPTDNCSAVGDVGDIILANMKDYIIIRKGNIKQDQSIHVRFVYGENCFRFSYRINGMPKKKAPLTIKNSTNTRGSFITLAAR